MKLLIEHFYDWEQQKPDAIFMRQPYGDDWKDISWKEAGTEIRKMATVLKDKGLAIGSHVGIISKNCYHWVLADLAIQLAGMISVPFYPNLSKKQLEEVIPQSDIQLLFIGKLDNFENISSAFSNELKLIKFPHYKGNAEIYKGESWNELIESASPLKENFIPDPDDLWTILFTSGTTSSPKGVMIKHGNFAKLIETEKKHDHLGVMAIDNPRFFSFLPLNHIAERMAVETGCLMSGGTIYFAESIDTFGKNLQFTQPSLFLAVPRIWSKFQLAILDKLPDKYINFILKIPIINEKFKKKIREGLGLGSANIILTGAAATPQSLKDWYLKFDIELQEVYGMTETCGGCVLMPKGVVNPKSTGVPLNDVDLEIDKETGEIKVRMPWIMSGYYKNEEKTNEVIKNGWLHTGDKGYVDNNGYLFIDGRVSDTFKSSKGKYIVPVPIEDDFSSNELVEQFCVVGLGITQPIALCLLSEIGKKSDKDLVESRLLEDLKNCNAEKANYTKLSTIIILSDDWSVENQLLTPTMKVKRNKVNETYSEKYQFWHEADESIIWE